MLYRALGPGPVLRTSLLLICLLVAGCGGGSTTPGSLSLSGPDPEQTPTQIAVQHVLTTGSARVVPDSVSSFRFTGFDSEGQVVLGPITSTVEERIVLDASPEVTFLTIEYLQDSSVVGYFETSLALEAGQTYTIYDPDFIDATAPLTGIEISGSPGDLIVGHAGTSLTVLAHFADGSTTDVTLPASYTSNLPNVIAVNSEGRVAAVGTGTAEIEARLFTRSDTVDLTGILDPATQIVSIEVLPATDSLYVSLSGQFQAVATFGDGGTADVSRSVVWSSSDPTVATVDGSGLVTAVMSSSNPVDIRATYSLTGVNGAAQLSVKDLSGPVLTLDTGSHTFDTTTGMLDGNVSPGWDGTKLNLGILTIPEGTTLELVGSQPFEVQSDFIHIAGLVDADGSAGQARLGGEGGPGGFAGGEADSETNGALGKNGMGPGGGRTGAISNSTRRYTGGGGGHLEKGRDGGNSGTSNTGDGGNAYDMARTGGSGGGGGGRVYLNPNYKRGGGGGGGGGVIILSTVETLEVTGILSARGGNGAKSGANGGAGDGGGGSGGRIELRGRLDITNATIRLNGGSNPASGSAGHGSAGRMVTEDV